MEARLLLSQTPPAFRSNLVLRQPYQSRSLGYYRRVDRYFERSSSIAGVQSHTATTTLWRSTSTRLRCFEWRLRFRFRARVDQVALAARQSGRQDVGV